MSSLHVGIGFLSFFYWVFYTKLKGNRLFHLSSLHGCQFGIINKIELKLYRWRWSLD